MNIIPTSIPDVLIIEPKVFQDKRGFFLELYQEVVYQQIGINDSFVQDNHSGSTQGVLRGLHYQIKHPQGKLVTVLQGTIMDVSVDLRKYSPTFRHWVGIKLSAEKHQQVWIPQGFAHGFYVLSSWAEILYKSTDFYHPEYESTLLWNDPDLNIDWHLTGEPIVSDKDTKGSGIDDTPVFLDEL